MEALFCERKGICFRAKGARIDGKKRIITMKRKTALHLSCLLAVLVLCVCGFFLFVHFRTQNTLREMPFDAYPLNGEEDKSSPYELMLTKPDLGPLSVAKVFYGAEEQTYKICILAEEGALEGLPAGIGFYLNGEGPLEYTFYYETVFWNRYLVFALKEYPGKQTVKITYQGKVCTAEFAD